MKWLLKAIFSGIKFLINAILLPLNILISALFPSVNSVVGYVNGFFNWIEQFVLWVKSWIPLPQEFWTIFVAVIVAYYTVPLVVHTIKLILAWYDTLKP